MDRMLTVGASGADVRELQSLLNARPPSQFLPLESDGMFGPKTLARVQEFQRNAALQPDGIVGPLTWGKLRAAAPDTPVPVRTGCACGNCDPANQARALGIQQAFASGFARQSSPGQPVAFRASLIPGLPTLPTLPTLKSLTPGQVATATGVFGSSIDYSKVYISDQAGLQNRPFTVAVPATPLTPSIQVMNMGTFTPVAKDLIHELAHVWQSQHHTSATQYMTNAVASQGAAVAANGLVATFDPSVKAHREFPVQYPNSAYAYVPGKAFGDYAAEQIANAVEHGEAAIVAHVKGVAKGAVDADNVTSLSTARIGDRRVAGTVF